ncbi:7257_t:CDS:10, partial [Funneliformis caledonium]
MSIEQVQGQESQHVSAMKNLLKNVENDSDCFKNVAISINGDCKKLETSEDNRKKYAILLTKCIVESANTVMPKICNEIDDELNIKRCVEYQTGIFQMCNSLSIKIKIDNIVYYHRTNTNNLMKYLKLILQSNKKREEEQEQSIKEMKQEFMEFNEFIMDTSRKNAKRVIKDFSGDIVQHIIQYQQTIKDDLENTLEIIQDASEKIVDKFNKHKEIVDSTLKDTQEKIQFYTNIIKEIVE